MPEYFNLTLILKSKCLTCIDKTAILPTGKRTDSFCLPFFLS